MLGRWRHLFKATAQAREGAAAAAVVEKAVFGIVAALNNKARDMFALILGLRMVVGEGIWGKIQMRRGDRISHASISVYGYLLSVH